MSHLCLSALFLLPMERPQGAGDRGWAGPPHVAMGCLALNRGTQWPTRRGVFRWKWGKQCGHLSRNLFEGERKLCRGARLAVLGRLLSGLHRGRQMS